MPATALAWLFYAAHETALLRRILRTGECMVRVDLLLLYPVLGALTVAGIVSARRGTRARTRAAGS